jgi:hypothetical protein
MTDKLSGRRARGAKLGMTVEGKKPGPYDKLGRYLDSGISEEERLEARGRRIAGRAAAKTQGKIPKVIPNPKKRGTRA